ncbi:MAG: hypothetical protein U5N55_01280 [Cypionkella sp.]|nr:hypothetical protein [Cypionkella sp.]
MDFSGTITQQNAGTIEADGASSVVRLNGDVTGGSLITTNGGQIWFSGHLGGTEPADQVVLTEGLYLLSEGGTLLGAIDNENTIHVSTGLYIGPEVTLTGGGEIRLGHQRSFSHDYSSETLPFSVIEGGYDSEFNSYESASLINTDNLISGAGMIGEWSAHVAVTLSVENQANGIIQADVAGKTLQISGVTSFVNDGLFAGPECGHAANHKQYCEYRSL